MKCFPRRSLLIAAACIMLTSCLEEGCVTVFVTNHRAETVVVLETECWPLDVAVDPGETGNIIVLPGEIVTAEGEDSGNTYTHIFTAENDVWEIN